jgi:hypothetical protein
MLGKLLIGAAALAIAAPATAQTVAITGGRVVIGDGSEPIDGGTVIIRNGRVVAAGAGVAVPADAQVVDAAGKWVTPGLVSGFSRIGLAEVDAAGSSNDTSAARSPFSAALDVAPAVNPQASAISINRACRHHPRCGGADRGREHLRGPGGGHRPRQRHGPDHAPPRLPVCRDGRDGGGARRREPRLAHALLRNACERPGSCG